MPFFKMVPVIQGASTPLGPLEAHRSDRNMGCTTLLKATVNTNAYRYPHVFPRTQCKLVYFIQKSSLSCLVLRDGMISGDIHYLITYKTRIIITSHGVSRSKVHQVACHVISEMKHKHEQYITWV